MKKIHFSRLWRLMLFCCMALTSQAQTVNINGHTAVGTEQGYPLFIVSTGTITVSSSEGYFDYIYIDDERVAYSSAFWSSYSIDITPYCDGDSHKLQLKYGSSNYGICYITSNEDLLVDGIYYSIESETAKVTAALSDIENAVIHETYTKDGVTYPVVEIASEAFKDRKKLKSVTIPNSVTSIGSNAFKDCSIIKAFWLGNTPPEGYNNVGAKVNYVSNNQYSLSNQLQYPFLSSMFTVDGTVYIPVSPSERTCDVVNCTYTDENKDVTISDKVINKGIEMSVMDIKQDAFYNNDYIQSLSLSNAGQVESYAFYDCDSLASLQATNTGNIGKQAFYSCDNLQTAEISNAGYIGTRAFYNCSNLQTANISNAGVIGSEAFRSCRNLQTANINNVGDIGSQAFYGCNSLQTANISNVGNIGSDAFYDCNNLQIAQLGEKVTGILSYAFSGCSSLHEMIIPNSVTSLKRSAFEGCSSLERVCIGTGVPSLPESVFSGCSSLASLSIPNNISSIDDGVFCGCSSLGDISFEDAENSDDVLVLGRNFQLDYLNNRKYAPLFSDCPLDEVYIGRRLSYQTRSDDGYSPFYRNTSLRTVEITDAETEIYDNEFYGCTNLKSLKIGNGVTTIGNWAFSGCSSMDYFSAGSHVESIGKEAFSDCTGLTKYYSYSVVPPTCDDQALDDINKWECTLYVPNESSDEYQAASQWKDFFFVEEMDAAAGFSDIVSDASSVSIDTKDGVIIVKGKRSQDLVSIYNSQGALVKATAADTITLSQHGIFIVRIGNATYKVIL